MKLVLVKNVAKLGQAGKIVDVADGYARNYLLPNNLAKPATDSMVQSVKVAQQKIKKEKVNRVEEAGKVARALQRKKYIIKKEANEQGTLFAGISAKDIANTISTKNYSVSPSQVMIDTHIKELGQHLVSIRLANGEVLKLTINIERK